MFTDETVKPMRVLVACEESQAVTIELRRLGHEAYSCDIEPCSGGHPEWHIMQDGLLMHLSCRQKKEQKHAARPFLALLRAMAQQWAGPTKEEEHNAIYTG